MKTLQQLFSHLRLATHSMFHVWCQEFHLTLKDIGVVIFFFVVPLLYPLLYSYIYSEEVVREVPVLVVDESRTSLSREYLRKLDATPDADIRAYCANMDEAKEMLRERKAYGILYIPRDFSRQLHRGEASTVTLFCDMSGLLYYKALMISNTEVSLSLNKDIKINRIGHSTEREEELAAYPISYANVPLFNHAGGFASFVLPGVLILILQQTLILGIGLSAGTTREHNRFHQLIPQHRHYQLTFPIVLGKALCYLLIYAAVASYVLGMVPYIFSLNQIGNPPTLVLFVLPYLLACIFFAMTCTIVIRNRETVMLIFVFSSVPLLFLSGISWPGSAIPDFWRYFSYLFPSTFGINGYVKIHNMGAELQQVRTEYTALWIQAVVYFISACLVYRRQIEMSRRNSKVIEKAN